eukprot:gene28943-37967_t
MKKNWHFIIPASSLKLISGENNLTEYKFNTRVARHMFCKTCGVQAYYHPRSNPDGVAITLACVDELELESYEIKKFDGQNWEKFFSLSGISNVKLDRAFSQPSRQPSHRPTANPSTQPSKQPSQQSSPTPSTSPSPIPS